MAETVADRFLKRRAEWGVKTIFGYLGDGIDDGDCRSWDITNLFICNGSVFPATGGVNPSPTIQTIARRTADMIKAMAHGRISCDG